jgi:hypothetical protein
MKYRSTLVLLLCVIVAGFVAYRLSRQPTSEERQEQRRRLLPGFDSSVVRAITIATAGGQITCRRESATSDWRLTEPFDARADRWAVDAILNRFAAAEQRSRVRPGAGEEINLADFGLDSPVRSVTMRSEDGQSWTVHIGSDSGVSGTVYAAVEGVEGVLGLEESLADSLDVIAADLRSKELAKRIGTPDLHKVALSAKPLDDQPPFVVECERADDAWQLTEPVSDLADGNEVEGVARTLYGHRASKDDFVSDDPGSLADYGLDSPDLMVTITGSGEVQSVIFSAVTEDEATTYYAKNAVESGIVKVPGSLFQNLRKEPAGLRERSLAEFTVTRVQELGVASADRELVLRKEGGTWELDGDRPAPADAGVVDELLRDLSATRIVEFVADEPDDLVPYGLAEGTRREVTLRDDGGELLAEALLGGLDQEGRAYAMRPGFPGVFIVRRERFYDRIERGRLALLDRRVLSEPADQARRIASTRGPERMECAREEGPGAGWRLTVPARGPADTEAVSGVLSVFGGMNASDFVAEETRDLSAYGLDDPVATVEVEYAAPPGGPAEGGAAEPERVRSVLLGAESPEADGSRYAKLGHKECVFVLSASTVERLRAGIASRQVCSAEGLRTLTFRHDGTELRFVYDTQADEWRGGSGERLPDAERQVVEDAAALVEDCRADRIEEYMEAAGRRYGFDQPYLVVEVGTKTVSGLRIVVGKEVEGGRLASGPESNFVLVLPQEKVGVLAAVVEPEPAVRHAPPADSPLARPYETSADSPAAPGP